MRNTFLAAQLAFAAVIALLCSVATAAPLLNEHFNYSTGGFGAVNGGSWLSINSGSDAQVTATSALTAPNSSGNGLAAAHMSANGLDYRTTVTGLLTADGSSIYASAYFRVDAITSVSSSQDATFMIATDNTNWPARMYLRGGPDSTHFDLGLAANNATTTFSASTSNLLVGTTYQVVLGLDIVAGTANDVPKLWVNPPLGNVSPTTPDAISPSATEPLAATGLVIRQGTTARIQYSIDEIKVSNNWPDVTPSGAAVPDWPVY